MNHIVYPIVMMEEYYIYSTITGLPQFGKEMIWVSLGSDTTVIW